MRKKQFVPLMIAAMCLMLLLAACDGGSAEHTGPLTSEPPVSGLLPTDNLPEHWSAAEAEIAFDGQDWESFFLSGLALSDKDFQYAADVTFAEKDQGLAALVFQSTADHNSCYVASISALTNRAELYKIEQGLQIPLGTEIGLEDRGSYHLQVNMIDSHIAFFVNDTLICSTGDYIIASDLGQNDALTSGQLGLYGSDGEVTFRNASYNIYDEGGAPALTALSLQAQSGAVEAGGNMLANGWYMLTPLPAMKALCSPASSPSPARAPLASALTTTGGMIRTSSLPSRPPTGCSASSSTRAAPSSPRPP